VSTLSIHRFGCARLEIRSGQGGLGDFGGVRSLEGLDQISTGFPKSLGTAELRGVRLNQCGIEVVLPDQEAEVVPQPGLTAV
jgi:hypothetical protein